MKIIITENQLRTLSEQMVSDEQCIQPEIEEINSVFDGLGELIGAEYDFVPNPGGITKYG